MAGISIKDLAAEKGRPYAAVLKAAHNVGIETPRGKNVQRLLTVTERKKVESELAQKKVKA